MDIIDALDTLDGIDFDEVYDEMLTVKEIEALKFILKQVSNFVYEAE